MAGKFKKFTPEDKKRYAEKKAKERAALSRKLAEEVLDIFSKTEKVKKWSKPWKNVFSGGSLPHNITTGKTYKYDNLFYLILASRSRGIDDPRFCSKKQALEYAKNVFSRQPVFHGLNWDKEKEGSSLDELAKSKDDRIRELVAWDSETPEEILNTLSSDKSKNVRRRVLFNENTPVETKAYLKDSENWAVQVKEENSKPFQIAVPTVKKGKKTLEEISALIEEKGKLAVAGDGSTCHYIPNPNTYNLKSVYVLKEGADKPQFVHLDKFLSYYETLDGGKFSEEMLVDWHKELKSEKGSKQSVYYKIFDIYNVSQFENFPDVDLLPPKDWVNHPLIEYMVESSNIKVEHKKQDSAFYDPSKDTVFLPEKDAFDDMGKYYSTLLHEWYHAIGHKDREGRIKNDHNQNKEEYSMEELRAQLFSMLTSFAFDIPHNFEESKAYIEGWNKKLKNDSADILKQMRAASATFSNVVEPFMYGEEPSAKWFPEKENWPDYESFKKEFEEFLAVNSSSNNLSEDENVIDINPFGTLERQAEHFVEEDDFVDDFVDDFDPFGSLEEATQKKESVPDELKNYESVSIGL